MNIIVHQNITIHNLKIEGITNSSVLQIGSAGIIKAESNLYNTGGFTGPAPKFGRRPGETRIPSEPVPPTRVPSLVPFQPS